MNCLSNANRKYVVRADEPVENSASFVFRSCSICISFFLSSQAAHNLRIRHRFLNISELLENANSSRSRTCQAALRSIYETNGMVVTIGFAFLSQPVLKMFVKSSQDCAEAAICTKV